MIDVKKITVEDFKALFARDFPYLTMWDCCYPYMTGDSVYFNGGFYQSKINNNCDNMPENGTQWQQIQDTPFNYVSDSDIARAFIEARANFNAALFVDDEVAKMVFCYLTAHYLVIDLNNAQNPLALGFMGFTQSKSVGSVSESFGIPQWMLNNPKLGLYAQTGYGRKYLSLIQPYLTGNIIYTPGAINFG